VDWIIFGNENETEVEIKKLSVELLGIFKRWKNKNDKNF
jgi:hypothetical protein|tara:strand:+ start:454 stop:570 length:117 start_codon:yes stop_codon:yes gene_type:complete